MKDQVSVKVFTLVVFLFIISVIPNSKPIRVACVGDSITFGFGIKDTTKTYPRQLGDLLGKNYLVENFGVNGRTMLKKGDYPYWKENAFKDALAFKPQIVIICLGTNDSKPWNWKYKNEFYSDYTSMVKTFRKDGKPEIFVSYCPPAFSHKYSISDSVIHYQIIPLIDSVKKEYHTKLINFYDIMKNDSSMFFDGIHPDEEGALIMAKTVRNAIGKNPIRSKRNLNKIIK